MKKACEIMLKHKPGKTVCGYVRNAYRPDETVGTLTLSELQNFEADMFTTVVIGNEATKIIGGKMVTLRGYQTMEGANES